MSDTNTRHVAFLGLGNMGARMARRLVDAGHDVVGFDPVESARNALTEAGGRAEPSAAGAITGAATVILMLPNSAVVEAILEDPAVVAALQPGMTVVDMSSSDPMSTRRLADRLAARGIALVDAPVSGGVSGAEAGTLTIMAGGSVDAVVAVEKVLAPMGTPRRIGDCGAGHAIKAINNLLAAVHLLATAEGYAAGLRFGLDPEVIVSTINAASGRSASTEIKFPKFVVPETYDSGFALALMLKDMRTATGLAAELGVPAVLGECAVGLWSAADADLGPGADQTEIARWVRDGSARATTSSASVHQAP
ncbi:NAD(P)-dependent oxidoreductase [Aldersonia sp. NBC_00410]|uniref:NAD(P)-dependent oxidoreductase n=1 Tax=Aldersonia sp. NBC_00410 TaxID=2975954 RepID=UPI00224D30B3|nr:NAD(P)-dependent oxidoreductase [Aldersonia sp. NBC_00410]MCX5044182.1 NAD(P)-dependent oxidoreductase [Aldersonia sp. NBC_00410]